MADSRQLGGPNSRQYGERSPGIRSFDHVSLPFRNTDAMLAFYRSLGSAVTEGPRICSVHFGDQKINFHRPTHWQDPSFTNRAPEARPPCGDFCVVWEGSPASLTEMLHRAGAQGSLGPVERQGGRAGGSMSGTSRYIRDPDGNLVEFMIYS